MDARKAFIDEFEKTWPLWGEYIKDKVSDVESGLLDHINSPQYFSLHRTENSEIIAELYVNNIKKRYSWKLEG